MVYERITRKLRYSLIRFSYLIFALCFRSICETAEKNVPLNMIKINVLGTRTGKCGTAFVKIVFFTIQCQPSLIRFSVFLEIIGVLPTFFPDFVHSILAAYTVASKIVDIAGRSGHAAVFKHISGFCMEPVTFPVYFLHSHQSITIRTDIIGLSIYSYPLI